MSVNHIDDLERLLSEDPGREPKRQQGPAVPIKRPQGHDWTMAIGKVGMWLAIVAFGGIFWAVNGGFSVLGLEFVASSFNSAGALLWAALAAITFPVPVRVPGLPITQPLIPWLGVLSATLLQIIVIYRKLRGLSTPRWMLIAVIVLSIYDFSTTFFGLSTVQWAQQAGVFIRLVVAAFLTFALEVTIGFSLRR